VKIDGLAPKERIIASFSRAALAVFLGIAVLIVGAVMPEYLKFFLSAGIVVLGLGVGLFASSLISLHLCKKWGIFNQ